MFSRGDRVVTGWRVFRAVDMARAIGRGGD